MKHYLSLFLVAMLASGAVVLSRPALAAEGEADEEGVSAYSVARLKIFQGTAWVRSPDSGEWEETTTNSPITERARINIPQGSEAELQFHGGQFVLLTGGTEVDIRKFDEANTVIRLRSGEVRFDLPPDDFSPVRMMIPGGGKVNFNVPGRYWLAVKDGGQTRLVVRSGVGVVSLDKGDFSVKAGEEATIGEDVRIAAHEGKGDDKYAPPLPMTEEERKAEVPPAAAYELRDYGEWVYLADYGWVWRPRVATGWSPYYYGRWAWVSPYGWTWVSYEPWGWYPYHFGWWASDPFFGWVWCPFRSFVSVSFVFGNARFAHFHRNTFFFPATVRFVRDGRSVRWVPLRPGERFVRSGFTRSDSRLTRWERPLERGTVFSSTNRGGKREWRAWTSTQRDRQSVQVRERSTVRPPASMPRPDGQERMQPRSPDRPVRMPQREFSGSEGRPVDRGVSSSPRQSETGSAVRPERVVRPPYAEPRVGNGAPDRGFAGPERGESGRTPEGRGEINRPAFRNPSAEGDSDRGGGGAGFNFGGRGERGYGGGRIR